MHLIEILLQPLPACQLKMQHKLTPVWSLSWLYPIEVLPDVNIGSVAILLQSWLLQVSKYNTLQAVVLNSMFGVQITTHWPSQNVSVFPTIGPGYYTIARDDQAAKDAYMDRLSKFQVLPSAGTNPMDIQIPASASACFTLQTCTKYRYCMCTVLNHAWVFAFTIVLCAPLLAVQIQ